MWGFLSSAQFQQKARNSVFLFHVLIETESCFFLVVPATFFFPTKPAESSVPFFFEAVVLEKKMLDFLRDQRIGEGPV